MRKPLVELIKRVSKTGDDGSGFTTRVLRIVGPGPKVEDDIAIDLETFYDPQTVARLLRQGAELIDEELGASCTD